MTFGSALRVIQHALGIDAALNPETNTPFPLKPYILAQTAVPVILPSSGSSNATGQITLTTALPYQPSGTVQIYLPSGVVTAGSQGTGAGLYSVTFSSTTVCQIQGTGIVTANGAYTQDTTQQTLATVVVPGGAMGANGALRIGNLFSIPNNANNKYITNRLNGVNVISSTLTTQVLCGFEFSIRNRNAQAIQVTQPTLASVSSTSAATYTTIDTSINQNLTFTGQLAVATDYIILEGYTIEVLPQP